AAEIVDVVDLLGGTFAVVLETVDAGFFAADLGAFFNGGLALIFGRAFDRRAVAVAVVNLVADRRRDFAGVIFFFDGVTSHGEQDGRHETDLAEPDRGQDKSHAGNKHRKGCVPQGALAHLTQRWIAPTARLFEMRVFVRGVTGRFAEPRFFGPTVE